MSIDFGSWMQGNGSWVTPQIPLRAVIEGYRIEDKMTSVVFIRNEVPLEPQDVRVEYDNPVTENNSTEAGFGNARKGVIFGVRGHPTIDDLDVERWDTFVMDNVEFTVTFVNKQLHGQIQASFEAVG